MPGTVTTRVAGRRLAAVGCRLGRTCPSRTRIGSAVTMGAIGALVTASASTTRP